MSLQLGMGLKTSPSYGTAVMIDQLLMHNRQTKVSKAGFVNKAFDLSFVEFRDHISLQVLLQHFYGN